MHVVHVVYVVLMSWSDAPGALPSADQLVSELAARAGVLPDDEELIESEVSDYETNPEKPEGKASRGCGIVVRNRTCLGAGFVLRGGRRSRPVVLFCPRRFGVAPLPFRQAGVTMLFDNLIMLPLRNCGMALIPQFGLRASRSIRRDGGPPRRDLSSSLSFLAFHGRGSLTSLEIWNDTPGF
jgi:hypothetical protein